MCRGPVDERVVVADHRRTPPEIRQTSGDDGKRLTERVVVVASRVARHSARGWTGALLRCLALETPIAPRAHDERAGAGQDAVGVGRTLRVSVGELHPPVETPPLAF